MNTSRRERPLTSADIDELIALDEDRKKKGASLTFNPTWTQVLNGAAVVLGSLGFAVACAAGYVPSTRVLGLVLGLLGVTIGNNWMMLTELRWRGK